MRSPRLLTLQLLNVAIGGGQYLAFGSTTAALSAGGWKPAQVGTAMMIANLGYMAFVTLGGRLSDRWGRARTAVLGASVCATAAAMALILGGPWSAAVALTLGCVGAAFFFPGNVGLFSDAQGDDGATPHPLHVKVSSYNLGWSGGNILGFGLVLAFDALFPGVLRVGWGTVLLLSTLPILVLWRWVHLPPSPPRAEGDRSAHPAQPRLMWMGRAALLLYCCIGMSLIGLLQNTMVTDQVAIETARRIAATALLCYAIGYFIMFIILGRWSGWIMRPWRLLAIQALIIPAVLGVWWVGAHGQAGYILAACGFILGLGFGAVYTGSIYYSLRLPEGAARAAALHETALGIGSTAGPMIGGACITWWAVGNLAGLGVFMVVMAALVLAIQAVLIPGAARLGARP